jgi:predicted transglutaminase-like cysteine proteinase
MRWKIVIFVLSMMAVLHLRGPASAQQNPQPYNVIQYAAAPAVIGTGEAALMPPSRLRLFGTREAFSRDTSPFTKWHDAMRRAAVETAPDATCVRPRPNCRLDQWRRFVDSLRGLAPRSQVEAINHEMNRRTHTRDLRNWGVEDYWASPMEFLDKSGDCEDFAIAKYVSLRALGWSDRQLRLVVLQDRRVQMMHAILVVQLEGETLVLDNQIPSVVKADSIRHYTPLYSINQSGWWLHRS